MSRIPIPEHLLCRLGPEMKMDVHWVDVKLKDNRCFHNLAVRGGRYLTGRAQDQNGEGELPFQQSDIANVRRHAFLGSLWSIWPAQSEPHSRKDDA